MLLIKREVTNGSITLKGCVIQFKPIFIYGTDDNKVPVDRGIWVSEEDYKNYPNNPTVNKLIEVPNAFYLDPKTAPTSGAGDNVITKMLRWVNEQAKAEIIAINKGWSDEDIEIIGL